MFENVYLPAVFIAAIASFMTGAIWYGLLSKPWQNALGMEEEEIEMKISTFFITFLCELVMAFVLATLVLSVVEPNIYKALMISFSIWIGFILMTLIINHRHQGAPITLTIIDSIHWLIVLFVQTTVYFFISGYVVA